MPGPTMIVREMVASRVRKRATVFFGHIHESDAHAEVRITDAYAAFGFHADAIRVQLHVQLSIRRVGGLCFHVTAMQADVAERGPGAYIAAFFAQFGTAFAFVARTAALFRALELIARVSAGCWRVACWRGCRGGLRARLLQGPQVRNAFVDLMCHKCPAAEARPPLCSKSNIGIAVTQGSFAEDSDVSIGRNNFED